MGAPDALTAPLAEYVANRDSVLSLVMESCKVGRSPAKALMLRVMYGGAANAWAQEHHVDPAAVPALVRSLALCIRELTRFILSTHPDARRAKEQQLRKKPDTHNPEGTRIAYIMQDIERKCLEALLAVVVASGREVGAMLHDGLLVRVGRWGGPKRLSESLLRSWEGSVQARVGFKVSLVEKV